MSSFLYSKQIRWVVVASLTSGAVSALLTKAHLQAAPIGVPRRVNTQSEPEITAASYIPNSVATYTFRTDPNDPKSDPLVVLVGMVQVEMVMPGQNKPHGVLTFGYTYITESDLRKFPTAMNLAEREEGIFCGPIDVKDFDSALKTVRQTYAEAHGLKLDELPPIAGKDAEDK